MTEFRQEIGRRIREARGYALGVYGFRMLLFAGFILAPVLAMLNGGGVFKGGYAVVLLTIVAAGFCCLLVGLWKVVRAVPEMQESRVAQKSFVLNFIPDLLLYEIRRRR